LLRHWTLANACTYGCSAIDPCKALNRKMLVFHIKKQQPRFFVCLLIPPCDCPSYLNSSIVRLWNTSHRQDIFFSPDWN